MRIIALSILSPEIGANHLKLKTALNYLARTVIKFNNDIAAYN